MKTKGYSFKCDNPFFVYFKKHHCPQCNNKLVRQKVSQIIHSDSDEAKNYNFEVADITVRGNMKFTHIEFHCPSCQRNYSIKETKENELQGAEVRFMGFLSKLFKGFMESKNAPEKTAKYEVQVKSLAEIWEIEDETNLIISLGTYIAQKCGYGENMSALSGPERVLYITQGLEMEVNNGGFSQYFFNSSGDLANELVDAYLEIGATKTAEICKRAVALFGQAVPADRDERDDFLSDNEEFDEILGECDDAFFAYEEDLNALTYAYVLQHKDSFR